MCTGSCDNVGAGEDDKTLRNDASHLHHGQSPEARVDVDNLHRTMLAA